MSHILLLHPGQMGAAIGRVLVASGHRVAWVPEGRSEATARRARESGLSVWDTRDRPDLVVSVCPPAAALSTAAAFAHLGTVYIDANAVSPDRAAAIAAIVEETGGTYVDASIIGPPPDPAAGAATRLYLSGSAAPDSARELGDHPELDILMLDEPYAASALKMTYAAWSKISAALILATRTAADRLGVDDALLAEWRHSQPQLAARHDGAAAAAASKAWRWAEEMRQIAHTFESCGLPPEFGLGAARVFDSYPAPGD